MPVHRRVSFFSLVSQFVLAGLLSASASAQTTVAGTTASQFAVSQGGAATYRIPIQVPPGVAGMEPKLELVYNSQSGNGLIGMGWGLAGFSAVNRCPRTMASDGVRGGVNLDANDRFCLDGQRLILTSGTPYGAAATEYRTEIESFSKITFDGTAFTVKTKAGLTIQYGATADSRIEAQGKTIVRTWAANKISDTVGNYLTIAYTEDNTTGTYQANRLDYTGNAAQATTSSVQIEYADGRLDLTPTYLAGSLIKTVKRLSKIKTYVGASQVKEYRLAYATQAAALDRSKLASITECDGANVCLAPISLTWTTDAGAFNPVMYTNTGGTNFGSNLNVWQVSTGDFNGDGKTDLMRVGATSTYTYLSNGDGNFTQYQYTYAGGANFGSNLSAWQISIGDVNGDGKADLMRVGSTQAYTYLSNGDGSYTQVIYSYGGANFGADLNVWQVSTGDFNGDGKTDLMRVGATQAYVYLSNGDGNFTQVIYSYGGANFGADLNVWQVSVGDFNGDGKTDLMRVGATQMYVYLSNGDGSFTQVIASYGGTNYGSNLNNWAVVVGDFNGDGKTDLMRVGATATGTYLSKGDGNFTEVISSYGGTNYGSNLNNWAVTVGDFNGDGKTDLMRVGATDTGTYLSRGDGTFTEVISSYGGGTNFGYDLNVWQVSTGDVSGDGKTDLLRVGATSDYTYLKPSGLADLLSQVVNTASTSFTYTPLTTATTYTKDLVATPGLVDIQTHFYVASSVVTSNGLGTTNTTTYNYGGLKSDVVGGRGMLGFRWTKSKEQATGVESYTEYRQDWPYAGIPLKSETRLTGSGNAGVLKRTTLAVDCKIPQTAASCAVAPGGLYFPHVTSRVDQAWDLNGTALPTEITNTAYNLNAPDTELRGDPTQITVSAVDGGFVSSRATANEYYAANTTNWILGRLKKTTVTNTGSTAIPGGNPGQITVLGVTVTPTSATVQLNGPGTGSTSVAAAASGGIGPYGYNWSRIVGSRTVISNGNTANPTFAATLTAGEDFTETLRVTLTDAIGGSTYRDVSVRFTTPYVLNQAISVNTSNYNLRAAAIAAGWDQVRPLNASITINAGVMVSANSVAGYGFDTGSGFPAGSALTLTNNGSIIGMGGAGGNGGSGNAYPPSAGQVGGPALKAQFALTVSNSGTIGGGGTGGTGGAGWEIETSGGCCSVNAGAGGGGGRTGATNSAAGIGMPNGGQGSSAGGGAGGVYSGEFGPYSVGAAGGPYGGGPAVVGNANIVWQATGTRLGALN